MRFNAGTLTAADAGARTLRYRLLPYGEPGRTSLGTVTVDRGVLHAADVPANAPLNLEHDPTRPVGVLSQLEDESDALYATFTILPTTAGDDLLTEAAAGVRTGVSVEIDGARIRAGRLVAGLLSAAAAVVKPAFPTALLTASDTEEPAEDDDTPDTDPGPVPGEDDEPATVTPNGDTIPSDDPEDPPMLDTDETTEAPAVAAATAPVLHASARPVSIRQAAELVGDTIRAVAEGRDASTLLAALTDVTATSTATGQGPQWLGELWVSEAPSRPFVESVVNGALTGIKPPSGWRWNLAPAVADYSGDKADVPSNSPTLTAITSTLKRLAGAHDLDRAIFDLGETELIEAYWREMAGSYAELSEDYLADTLVAGATNGTTAAGIVLASSAADVVVGAALQVAAVKGARPSFVGMAPNLYAEMLTNPASAALEFLSGSMGFDGGGNFGGVRIFMSPSLATDTVVAGDRRAARYFELPGSPIRAQAVNMPEGGIDVGVFGYAAAYITKPTAIVKIIRPAA